MKKLLTTVVMSVVAVFMLAGCTKKKDLSVCDEKRKGIEEKYGINILYGDDEVESEDISNIKLISDENKIMQLLEEIEEYFSNLPKDFISELMTYSELPINITIIDDKKLGVILYNVQEEYWIVNEENIKSDLARDMIYSIYWNVNHAENSPGFVLDWDKYNPLDFEYGDVEKNKKYMYGEADLYNTYFVTEKMMQSIYDDIEHLFSYLWQEEYMKMYNTTVAPKIQAKFEYLCSELDRVFETVDENTYWARYINNKG